MFNFSLKYYLDITKNESKKYPKNSELSEIKAEIDANFYNIIKHVMSTVFKT